MRNRLRAVIRPFRVRAGAVRRRWFTRHVGNGILALLSIVALWVVLRASGAGATDAIIATAAIVTGFAAIATLVGSERLLEATRETSLETARREIRDALPLLDVSVPAVPRTDGRYRFSFVVTNGTSMPALDLVVLVFGRDAGDLPFEGGASAPLLQPKHTQTVTVLYAAYPARSARLTVRCKGRLGGEVMQVFEWLEKGENRFERTKLTITPSLPSDIPA